MTDYFETMGIPIVEGRGFEPTDAASPGLVAVVNETLVQHVLEGPEPDRPAAAAGRRRPAPWFTVSASPRTSSRAASTRRPGTEFYFLVDQTASLPPPVEPGARPR